MDKMIGTTKQRVMAAAAGVCSDVERVLRKLFPEVFSNSTAQIGQHFLIKNGTHFDKYINGIYVLTLTGTPTIVLRRTQTLRLINILTGRKLFEEAVKYELFDPKTRILTVGTVVIIEDTDLRMRMVPVTLHIDVFLNGEKIYNGEDLKD